MLHRWHFFRAGAVDQVTLRDGFDLLALPDLDQKLWVALAMYVGRLDNYLPDVARSTTVLGEYAPAYKPPAK